MEKYHRLSMRKSNKKAIVAIGRKILVIIWNMLKEKKRYNANLVGIYDPIKIERTLAYHRKEMEKAAKLLHKEII
jgi:hypothetical protein